ncbi:MAG: hypothetical protein V3U75_04275 [Methylococcaceae bacterium]
MIQPIKDRKQRRQKPKKNDSTIKPKPEWVEAFLILLLHKTGGALTVSLKSLENFGKLKEHNKTLMSYDPDSKLITIRAPEVELPERIWKPRDKKIITEIN